MKYTVVIRQPVPDEVRPTLEKELVERFGLNAQQAERLSGRRAGRLLKPTTQARADLLLRVYQSAGVQVLMEEIPEETDAPSQAFATAAPVDDAVLAPPLLNDTSAASFMSGQNTLAGETDAFSPVSAPGGGTFVPSDDPFAATFASTDPSPSANITMGDWIGNDPNIPPDNNPEVNLLSGLPGSASSATGVTSATEEAVIARELLDMSGTSPLAAPGPQLSTQPSARPAPTAPAAKPADDWADFAGSLQLPETAAQPATPRATTEFLTAVTEDATVKNMPRTSLARQILLGTLLPVGVSSLLTLGLLGLTLPAQQNRATADNATNLATVLSNNLDSNLQAVNELQINSLIANPAVSYVRVETPDGKSYVRSRNPAENDALNKALTEAAKTSPSSGRLNYGGESSTYSRVAVIRQGDTGKLLTVPSDSTSPENVVRRVTVGLSNAGTSNLLRNLLLFTLLSTALGLLTAWFLANQAARRVVQPINELVKVADAISLGDLTRPVKATTNDEVGDLAQALERMRLSLEAAMDRLRRRKR